MVACDHVKCACTCLQLGGSEFLFIVTINSMYHFNGDIKITVGSLTLSLASRSPALQTRCSHTAGLEDGMNTAVELHSGCIVSGPGADVGWVLNKLFHMN